MLGLLCHFQVLTYCTCNPNRVTGSNFLSPVLFITSNTISIYILSSVMNFNVMAEIKMRILGVKSYILKVKKFAESAFQSQKICGKSA